MSPSYSMLVGEKLRNIRLQKGLSLHDVEVASGKRFKASVLGAYERGERTISVSRLHGLARFYGVPVDQLLPRDPQEEDVVTPPPTPSEKIRIDLNRLGDTEAPEGTVLQRYLNMIQVRRGDFNGRVLTIRQDDLRAIASVLDLSPEMLMGKIDDMGLKATLT
ncbi:MAG: transcriptional regulator [Actinomycetota bacterium]|jgi:transcriptional regulator with XRE-family HTH domain